MLSVVSGQDLAAQQQFQQDHQTALLVNDLQEKVVNLTTEPAISLERIAYKSEAYKKLIQKTLRNKRLVWFAGGACVVSVGLYLFLSHYANQQSNAKTSVAAQSGDNAGKKVSRDEAFADWWDYEKRKNTTVLGGMQGGIYDGIRIAFISIVVGVLLKQFDKASGSFTKFFEAVIGQGPEVLFDQIRKHCMFSLECLSSSLQTLLQEFHLLSVGQANNGKIPSFFFDALLADIQSLAFQLEELMALGLAVVSVNAIESVVFEKHMLDAYQATSECIDHCTALMKDNRVADIAQAESETLIMMKKLSLAIARYLSTSKSVLFGAE